ncbi:MAG: potassium transporter TrkG [Lachnospiraceae bacterium]
MNRRMVFYMIGQIIKLEAVLLVLPLAVSIIYRERCALSFLITALASLFVGFAVTLISKPGNRLIYAKEGFVIVALAWLALSAIGAVPFVLSGEVRSYADAFFETVSGFTTTGASVLTDIEGMSHGLLSAALRIGPRMGVLVFIMAIIPSVCDRSIHILRAEMPGPVMGKLVPKLKQTAKILYLIYIVMTVLEMILLLCGGMSLFDSALHSFATAGTGGFGIKGDSIASYSPYLQWVIAAFMFLFGINFNIYYLLLVRRFRSVLRSTEMAILRYA